MLARNHADNSRAFGLVGIVSVQVKVGVGLFLLFGIARLDGLGLRSSGISGGGTEHLLEAVAGKEVGAVGFGVETLDYLFLSHHLRIEFNK